MSQAKLIGEAALEAVLEIVERDLEGGYSPEILGVSPEDLEKVRGRCVRSVVCGNMCARVKICCLLPHLPRCLPPSLPAGAFVYVSVLAKFLLSSATRLTSAEVKRRIDDVSMVPPFPLFAAVCTLDAAGPSTCGPDPSPSY